MNYVYSVIRYVPDPVRGEFINVGAVAGCPDTVDWAVRQIDNPKRARYLDDAGAIDAVWQFITRLGRAIDQHETRSHSLFQPERELDEQWLWALHNQHRNLVQLSPPMPVNAQSASQALDVVFEEMVLSPEKRRSAGEQKYAATLALRQAFVGHHLRKHDHFHERVEALTKENHLSQFFDFALANGRVLQLSSAWSFQVASVDEVANDVKAWGWTVADLRKKGAHVVSSDGGYEARADVKVAAVYIPPRTDLERVAFHEASSVFAELGVSAQSVEAADVLGAEAESLLISAGVDLTRLA